MKVFYFIGVTLMAFLGTGCSTVYYVGETPEPVALYAEADMQSTVLVTIPASRPVLIKHRSKRYNYVVYVTYSGYLYKPTFLRYHKFNSTENGSLYGYSTSKPGKATGGTVQVKGYYRKNGTYVRPYTRSAPSRRH
jgi:hypothetical protein